MDISKDVLEGLSALIESQSQAPVIAESYIEVLVWSERKMNHSLLAYWVDSFVVAKRNALVWLQNNGGGHVIGATKMMEGVR